MDQLNYVQMTYGKQTVFLLIDNGASTSIIFSEFVQDELLSNSKPKIKGIAGCT